MLSQLDIPCYKYSYILIKIAHKHYKNYFTYYYWRTQSPSIYDLDRV